MRSSNFLCKLIFVLILGTFQVSFAQIPKNVDNITDNQLEQFLKQAESKGMSEAQIEAAALANGYSAQDIATIRERINRLKTGTSEIKANTGEAKSGGAKIDNVTREQIGEVAERAPVAVSDKQEVGKKAETFGSQLFNNKSLTFEPNLRLPTPKNYILGPDDELKIDITGYAYQHYDVKVSPEGTIKLENLSPLYINGNTVEQAKVKITERLKTLFAGLKNGTLSVDITLGNVRTIKVTLVGEVTNPGTYSVSSLATVFNALYLSGGPNRNGSFRDIQVFRNNVLIKRIDLYNFLLKGTLEDNINLNDQDVILVPLFGKKVEIDGELRRKGIFELQPEDNFQDLLSYAGGYTEQAYTATVNVNRNTNKERKLLTFDPQINTNFPTQNGDRFFIGTILDRFENKVEIRGAVFRPGEFALGDKIKTVKQLIQNAEGLREDAYLSRAILIREQDNLDPKYIPLDIEKIMSGELPDVELKRQDQLTIKSIVEIRQERKVKIIGAVNNPGVYPYAENMFLRDLILIAGGITDYSYLEKAILVREQKDLDPIYIQVELSKIMRGEIADIELQKQDQLIIKSFTELKEDRKIEILGAVNKPGTFQYAENMSIRDLILMANGFTEGATAKRIEVARHLYNDESINQSVEIISLDLTKDLSQTNKNFKLKPFDKVFVRNLPNYQVQQLIQITGEVNYPGSYVIENQTEHLSDIIQRAGGLRPEAYINGAKFYRNNTLVFVDFNKALSNKKTTSNLLLESGDRIEIPKERQTITISGQVLSPTSVAYQPNFSFREYIAQAGGFADSAFVKKTYVRYANGSTNRTRGFAGIKAYPKVEQGMTIFVPTRNRVRMTPAERIAVSTGLISVSAVLLTLIRLL